MPLRLIPALCAMLLAGCASSESTKISYAPLAVAAPSVQPASIVSTPLPPALPASPSAPSPYDQPADHAAAVGAPSCKTVGNATMCDAPTDPYADFARNTN